MQTIFLVTFVLSSVCSAFDITGAWKSDCQNYASSGQGYSSIQPIDTFTESGTATLRVHAFEKKNCKGKEWDAEIISCTYDIGAEIAKLKNTKELNLLCDYSGTQHWYEIVEREPTTIRFGNHTGMSPSERPDTLGNVYYHKD